MTDLLPMTALLAAALLGLAEPAAREGCVPGGGGRLAMEITGQFEALLDWHDEGTRCEGGPRPDGDALRLMFRREDDSLLVVIGITGLERGGIGEGLLANLTVVREGRGEFYGTLGADACVVTVEENLRVEEDTDAYRVSGSGRCVGAIEAIAREGEIRVDAFEFSGVAFWPEDY